MSALRSELSFGDQVLWTLRYSARYRHTRLAPAPTRRNILQAMWDELSRKHQILRTVRQAHQPLSLTNISL